MRRACVGVPRLVPLSSGSGASDQEALTGCCHVSLILLHRGVAIVEKWTRISTWFPTPTPLPSHYSALYPFHPSPSCHRLRLPVRATGHVGTISSHRSASTGSGNSSEDSLLPPPTPNERGTLARAGQQDVLALFQRFVQ